MNRCVIMADRYNYLGSVGLSFILAYAIVKGCPNLEKWGKALLRFMITIMFLYLCIYTNMRSRKWYNTETIKKELIER